MIAIISQDLYYGVHSVKNFFAVLLFFAALAPRAVFAADAETFCLNVFKQLRLIPGPIREVNMTPSRLELALSGSQLTKKWIPPLPNETYLYVIDETGSAWITPQLALPAVHGKHIASHRSLINQKVLTIPNSRIVAAGELIVKNGIISIINNKSGSYRGDETNLRYAEFIFKTQYQLDIPEHVTLLDVSTSKTTPAEIHAKRLTLLENANTHEYQSMRERWELLLLRMHKLYPDPQSPGDFNSNYIDDIYDMFASSNRSENEYLKTLKGLAGFLASHVESLDHVVGVSLKDPVRAKKIQDSLEQFIKTRENPRDQNPLPNPQMIYGIDH